MIEIKCPNSGKLCSDFFKRGKTKAGSQRYTCRKCGFTTVSERKEKQTGYSGTKRLCCKNQRIVANGTYKVELNDGMIEVRQRYRCTVCRTGFSHPLRYE